MSVDTSTHENNSASVLTVQTAAGQFHINLFDNDAPHTCQYFRRLVGNGMLDDGAVFRITTAANYDSSDEPPIEVIQIGTPLGLDEPRQCIPHESTSTTGLLHRQYTVSASRFGPGELYGSFFICMRDEPALNYGGERHVDGLGYAAFGEVVAGQKVLERIYDSAGADEVLSTPIPLHEIRLGQPDTSD